MVEVYMTPKVDRTSDYKLTAELWPFKYDKDIFDKLPEMLSFCEFVNEIKHGIQFIHGDKIIIRYYENGKILWEIYCDEDFNITEAFKYKPYEYTEHNMNEQAEEELHTYLLESCFTRAPIRDPLNSRRVFERVTTEDLELSSFSFYPRFEELYYQKKESRKFMYIAGAAVLVCVAALKLKKKVLN